MNFSETPGGASAPDDLTHAVAELHQSVTALRRFLQSALVLLIVIVSAINLYLWRQSRIVRAQAHELRTLIQQYEQEHVPVMNQFTVEMLRLAPQYPELAQLLAKYPLPRGLTNQAAVRPAPAGSAAPPSAAPAPAPAPARKP